jgi:hypothetical protein
MGIAREQHQVFRAGLRDEHMINAITVQPLLPLMKPGGDRGASSRAHWPEPT